MVKVVELNLGGLTCVGALLHATSRTDDSVTNRDRMSEVSRGHSRWTQTGEGLKALQRESRSNGYTEP